MYVCTYVYIYVYIYVQLFGNTSLVTRGIAQLAANQGGKKRFLKMDEVKRHFCLVLQTWPRVSNPLL